MKPGIRYYGVNIQPVAITLSDSLLELGKKEPYFRFSMADFINDNPPDINDEFFVKWLDEEVDKMIELEPKKEEKKKCTCPDVNFYYNGIGCKCNGV